MSAEVIFQAAIIGALGNALGARLNGIYEGPAVKATAPYAEIGELASIDWSTKDTEGRELRSLVQVRDRGESAARLQTLARDADAAIRALDPVLTGWRIISLVLVRNRIVRSGVGQWSALIEHRVRMLAE